MLKIVISILLLSFSLAACTLEIGTNISITDNKNPPTFTLSGTGASPLFMMGGPYTSVNDATQDKKLWEITTGDNLAGTPIWRLSSITYGTLPNGFIQQYPQQGPPLPLEEGKYYFIFVYVHSAPSGKLCIKIQNNSAIEVERE